jgi:hypothetical protein
VCVDRAVNTTNDNVIQCGMCTLPHLSLENNTLLLG